MVKHTQTIRRMSRLGLALKGWNSTCIICYNIVFPNSTFLAVPEASNKVELHTCLRWPQPFFQSHIRKTKTSTIISSRRFLLLNGLFPNAMSNAIDKYVIITFSIVNNPLTMPSKHVYNWKSFFRVHDCVLLGSYQQIPYWKQYCQKIFGYVTASDI